MRDGGYVLGEHATALLVDLQSVYCVGAYLSVIIIGCAIVDTHLRETEFLDSRQGMKSAFNLSEHRDELEWLRRRRNALVHFEKEPAITVDDHWNNRETHEADAKRAIAIVANVLREQSWI